MKWIYKQPHRIQKSGRQIFEFVIKSPTIFHDSLLFRSLEFSFVL